MPVRCGDHTVSLFVAAHQAPPRRDSQPCFFIFAVARLDSANATDCTRSCLSFHPVSFFCPSLPPFGQQQSDSPQVRCFRSLCSICAQISCRVPRFEFRLSPRVMITFRLLNRRERYRYTSLGRIQWWRRIFLIGNWDGLYGNILEDISVSCCFEKIYSWSILSPLLDCSKGSFCFIMNLYQII